MGKLRPREVESLARGHPAGKWQSLHLSPSLLVAEYSSWAPPATWLTPMHPRGAEGSRMRCSCSPSQLVTETTVTGWHREAMCRPGPGWVSHLSQLAQPAWRSSGGPEPGLTCPLTLPGPCSQQRHGVHRV